MIEIKEISKSAGGWRGIIKNEYSRQWDVIEDFLYFLSMPHVAKWIWISRCLIFGLPTLMFLFIGWFVSYEYFIPGAIGIYMTYTNIRRCVSSWKAAKVESLLEEQLLKKANLIMSKSN